MSTEEIDGGEPDEFARTDLRTGQPAPERSRRAVDRDLLGRLMAHVTVPRAVVAAITVLILAALVATQLGYTQRLLDAARYRIQMFGVPELTETTIAPQPAAHLSMANWEKVPLPAPANQLNDFSADPTDPESLLVCGHSSLETPTVHGEITPRGPVAIWLTHDAGKTWTQSQTPAISGTYCWISRAPDAPRRLTLTINRPAPIHPNCSEFDVLLSDDNGGAWRPMPTIFSATEDAVRFCSHSAFIVGGRLFLYTNWNTGATESDFHTSLVYSDDGGRHWSEVSGDSTQFLYTRFTFLANGAILTVRWPPQQPGPQDTILWISADKGDSWRPLSTLQRIAPDEVLAPFGAQSVIATTDHPLYLSYNEHLPLRLLYLKAAQIVDDRHWAYLPPLPAPGTSADHAGLTSILGVTASGRLLAFGVNPRTGIQTDRPLDVQFNQQWLWSWDPHTQSWTTLAPPLPVAWKACSDGCWHASLSYGAMSQEAALWVRGFDAEQRNDQIYRLMLPAEIA